MTNNTEQRRAFEASMVQQFGYTTEEFNFADGEYLDKDLNDLYLTWQAALAQRENTAKPLEQVGEWVMVPREPTYGMIQAGLNAPAYGHPETATPKLSDIYTAMLFAAPAPSLCTAEEAVELANTCDCIFDPLIDNWLIDNDDLAQIINADRAKR
jgi:hypothetical protein